jgi:hypothetical protein
VSYIATDARLITTGMLPVVILASAVLTAPISLFLLRWYRRAVLRAMAEQTGTPPTAAVQTEQAAGNSGTLQVRLIDAGSMDATATPPAYRRALASLASATTVYGIAGLSYALVMTGAWLVFTSQDGVILTRTLWLFWCYAWPTTLAVAMVAAISRGQRVAVGAAYFAVLSVVAVFGLVRNSELSVGQLVTFWLLTNAPPTLLLLAFLHRRLRAVGPLVLAFMVTAVIGSQILLSAVGSGEAGMRAAVAVGSLVGFGGTETFYALMALGFAIFAVAGWWLLKWIGRRYEQRRISDQSLTLDAMWILFGVEQAISMAFEGWLWVFTGIVAFVACKVVATVGFMLIRPGHSGVRSPTLLLLRVFALGSKSERLYDALSKRWLRAGSISMIAGPDLVESTVEPHEFLEFLGGRLSRNFVRSDADLQRRLEAQQSGPDPDGRYRVNEFFCYADTWRHVMRTLAAGADAILMDLRSFSPSNQGCLYELEQLLDSVSLDHIVFLIDNSTDQAFLERSLQDAWLRVRADSPNRRMGSPEVRLVHTRAQKSVDINGLLKLLLAQSSRLAAISSASA